MNKFKDKTWYQILFVPKKGKMITVMVWGFILTLTLIGIFHLYGCQKPRTQLSPQNKAEVRFVSTINNRGLKTAYTIDHVQTIVDSDTILLDVFYDNGVPFTTTFELGAGEHTVSHFIAYDSLGNEIGAAPLAGSTYDYLVEYDTLPKTFTVIENQVTEVGVTILYMTPEDFDLTNFGYAYFAIDAASIHTASFYGLKGTLDSLLYHYDQTTPYHNYNPPQTIMHAVYYIHYLHKIGNGDWASVKWYRSATIEDGYVYNIPFIDYDNVVDSSQFKIELCSWYPPSNNVSFWTTGATDYSMSIMIVDDNIANGIATFAFAPDSSWFPNVDYFFKLNW